MESIIQVLVRGQYGSYVASVNIDALQRECFEPLRTSDTPFGSGMHPNSNKAIRVVKVRKHAAEHLSKELANIIIDAMENNDTHNGYKLDGNR